MENAQGKQYVEKSFYSKSVENTCKESGCYDMSDKSNRDKEPTDMKAAKVNKQEMGGKLKPGYNPSGSSDRG